MGLDGFSMGNLGLNTELTSAQLVNQAELSAQKESEFKIKNITGSEEEQLIKRKEEQEEKNNQSFDDGFEEKKEDDEEGQDEDSLLEDYSPAHVKEKDIENANPKDFAVRINPQTDSVELFSKKEERVLETISAKDLMGLVSKLNSASGILVNRKI